MDQYHAPMRIPQISKLLIQYIQPRGPHIFQYPQVHHIRFPSSHHHFSGLQATPTLLLYSKSGDTLTQFYEVDGNLAAQYGCDISKDGERLLLGNATSNENFMNQFLLEGTNKPFQMDDFDDYPLATCRNVAYGANDAYVAMVFDTSPYVHIFKESPILPNVEEKLLGNGKVRAYIRTGL